jgi:DNA-binding IclR family transcriptional regulator
MYAIGSSCRLSDNARHRHRNRENDDPVLAVSELTRRLRSPRTNVVRLLATLEKNGFVERHPSGSGYQVGMRAFEIGTSRSSTRTTCSS